MIQELWQIVKVIFIHKAGKIKHCRANDFRPKILSSFFIKSLEKFIDEDLRGHLSTYDISSCQHAYKID